MPSRKQRRSMALFDIKVLLTLIMTILAATIATGLTLASGATWPCALIAGGAAGWAVLVTLPKLIK
jgi:hypothetical protein